MNDKDEKRAVYFTLAKLIALAMVMFVFAMWVMPPLYTLFCEVTGLNGKTSGRYQQAVSARIDNDRTIRVKFVVAKNANMPWIFKPGVRYLDVHPGAVTTTYFYAKNPTDQIMAAQAVPSLVPQNAADFFHKTECFCFNQQVLNSHEDAQLGLQFIVDQSIPKAVNSIILSYTLFDTTKSLILNENKRSDTEDAP